MMRIPLEIFRAPVLSDGLFSRGKEADSSGVSSLMIIVEEPPPSYAMASEQFRAWNIVARSFSLAPAE